MRMLIAPAGYGKTTLAEQWVVRDGRRGTWFTARSSSTDVAALALGIAKSATSIVPECDVRLRTHMRALPAPAENVQTLAEILGEDLAEWPSNAWLVIDDYHEIAQEPKAEEFIDALVALSPVQFLIASRVRPSWVTTKHRLYGEALEVNQAALAMDTREAADVLVERNVDSASGLVALANGWPAVIGLASVSSAEIRETSVQVPESLYRFFADEVFSALGAHMQRGLAMLSAAPVLDFELAVALLGDAAESICAAAIDVGLLVEREGRLDLHPLARAFLEDRSGHLGLRERAGLAEACLEIYRNRREWDPAFEVLIRANLTSEIESLVRDALDDLLDAARLPTLERWCAFASRAGLDAPVLALARAETMLRYGRQVEAITHAEIAAAGDASLAFRALSVAARAAHLASRDGDALVLWERARTASQSDRESRDAKWGQLVSMIELELPAAAGTFAELASGVGFADPRELVRTAAYRVYLQLHEGSLDLDDADVAYQLLPAVGDPLVVSAFLSPYGNTLVLTSRYADALAVATQLLETAKESRLDFALVYAYAVTAMACTGLKRWQQAEQAALAALAEARATRNIHADLLSRAILLRLYAQQGRLTDALRIETDRMSGAPNAVVAEFACSRALVFACAGRVGEARELLDEVRDTTSVVELRVLAPAVDAVCVVREGASDVVDRALEVEAVAFQTGAVDLLVTAYRACPELLPILLRSTEGRRFRTLMEVADDEELARTAGYPIAINEDRRLLLTPRETEVFELLRTGASNRDIARMLVIEESTAKAHTHRIYDKLGVRSRSALAIQAVLERAAQATSATESSTEVESP